MPKIFQCLIVDDEPVAREILEEHLKKVSVVNIVASCKNAMDAFAFMNSQKIDLIFLDINMPEISGLSFAKSINKNIKIIFTTAYREYAVDGFDLQAVDYLLKPISFERLLQAINKYLDENIRVNTDVGKEIIDETSDFIFVRSDRKMIKINFLNINYIESLSDYIKIYLTDKTIVTRETITSIEAKLPKKDFIRVHRSYIVSISKIDLFTNEYVELNKKVIPISRTYKNDVLQRLENV
ncbi:MAG: DNA-binding response regulator [Bacteroidetes bacterium]|nr:MAG: DNA-binding response regulator [Bacteroidota bacterium]